MSDGWRVLRRASFALAAALGVLCLGARIGAQISGEPLDPPSAAMSWGYNGVGELGQGAASFAGAPDYVTGLTRIVSIEGGDSHALAIDDNATVWSWGYNNVGQLGLGDTTNRVGPQRLPIVAKAIAAGGWHSLAIASDGTVYSWGYNSVGQLGAHDTTDRWRPVPVAPDGGWESPGVVAVAAGAYHSLALTRDGAVWGWGSGGRGQLGPTAAGINPVPIRIPVPAFITAIASGPGESNFSLALDSSGQVWAWGANDVCQLGVGGCGTDVFNPARVQLPTGSRAKAIAAGNYHAAAILVDGTVFTWGSNEFGQLGLDAVNSPAVSPVPQRTHLTIAADGIAAGARHTVVRTAGGIFAVGENRVGQLGTPPGPSTGTWTLVPTSSSYTWGRIATQGYGTFALRPFSALLTPANPGFPATVQMNSAPVSGRLEWSNATADPITVDRIAVHNDSNGDGLFDNNGDVALFSVTTDGCTGVTVAPGGKCAVDLKLDPHVLGRVGGKMDIATETSHPSATAAWSYSFSVNITDSTPPIVTIANPIDGATVLLNANVPAVYSCSDPDSSATCSAPVKNGAGVDTATVGDKSFSVVGTNAFGWSTSQSVTYHVVAARNGVAGSVFITNVNYGTVSVIDAATAGVVDRIAVGPSPYAIALTPDARFAYVTDWHGGTVSVIDTLTDAVVNTLAVGAEPLGVVVAPDGRRAYVTNSASGSVSVLDTIAGCDHPCSVVATYNVGRAPIGVAVTPDGSRLYVGTAGDGVVTVLDAATGNTVTSIPAAGAGELVMSLDGTRTYATWFAAPGFLYVIDTATNTVVATLGDTSGIGFGWVHNLAIAPDGRHVYATRDEPGGNLISVDTETLAVSEGPALGSYPRAIAPAPDGTQAFIPLAGQEMTTVVGLPGGAALQRIATASAVGAVMTRDRQASSIVLGDVAGTFGGTVTLKATLLAGSPLAGRPVRFFVNGAPAGSATTDGSGAASIVAALSGLAVGTVPIRATFDGDAGAAPSSAAATLTIARAVPTISWSAPAAVVYGTALSPVQLDATSPVPGGFSYSPGNGTVLPAGVQKLTATFTPTDTATYSTATASTTLTVNPASTVTTTAVPATAALLQPVTLVATVSPLPPAAAPPTGAVQFFDGATLLGSAPVTQNRATLVVNGLTSGAHSIVATYGGEANYAASTAQPASLTIQSAAASTFTALVALSNPSAVGQPAYFIAVVRTLAGALVQSGSAQLFDAQAGLVATAPVSGGYALLPVSTLASGVHLLIAQFAGDATTAPSVSAPILQTVYSGSRPAATTLRFAVTPNPVQANQPVTMTATLGGASGTPAGVVLFFADSTLVGAAPVVNSGGTLTATLTRDNLPRGVHVLSASYSGDPATASSNAPLVLMVVQ